MKARCPAQASAMRPPAVILLRPLSVAEDRSGWQSAGVRGGRQPAMRRGQAIRGYPLWLAAAVAVGLLASPWLIALALASHHHLGATVVSILAAASIPLSGLWLTWVTVAKGGGSGAPVNGLSTAQVADQIAVAVGKQWAYEAAIRRLNDPYPLPVSWEAADSSLTDSWDSLVKLASSGAGWPAPPPVRTWALGPGDLAGKGGELAEVLARVPTGRLVVLGEPGAGKTMLMVRLVLDLLARRAAGGSVPFLTSIASWDPTKQDLRDWLGAQLLIDHPALAGPPADRAEPTHAAALLASGLILPVLDGLDEIPEKVRGPAIGRINDALRPGEPVVITSRTRQYRDAVRPQEGIEVTFRAAAAIELRPLDVAVVRAYLCDDAAGPLAKARWDPVLAVLGTDAPAGQALRTPLMVGLARAMYNPRPGELAGTSRDPAELCDPALCDQTGILPEPAELTGAELGDRDAVESRLFDGFIPALYRDLRVGGQDRGSKRRADRAEAALLRLAQDLGGSTDLRWWKPWTGDARAVEDIMLVMPIAAAALTGLAGSAAFGDSIPRRLTAAVAAGIGVLLLMQFTHPTRGVAPRLGGSWGWEHAWGHSLWTPIRVTLACAVALVPATWLEVTVGPLGAAAWLLACLLALGLQPKTSGLTEAASPRLSLARERRATIASVSATALVIGPGLGLACGTALGLLAGLTSGIAAGLVAGLAIFPIASLVLFGVLLRHVDPQIDLPLEVAAVAGGLGASLLLAADTALIFALGHPAPTGVLVGYGYGTTLGFGGTVIQSAWPRWLIFRGRLSTSRQAPWRLMAFLEDAHRRGVLRQSGAVYQFRHLKLQHRLAARSRDDDRSGGTRP
jgi:hypothetical protein